MQEERTVIYYEAPHRLVDTLTVLQSTVGGSRKIAVCRELTKKYEEVYRGCIESALEYFREKGVKGEFTLIIEGVELKKEEKDIQWAETRFKELIDTGIAPKDAVKIASKEAQINKRELYELVMKK